MVAVLRIWIVIFGAWCSSVMYCSLMGMADNGNEFEANQAMSDDIVAYSENKNLLSDLLLMESSDQVEQIINDLEEYALRFVSKDDCEKLFCTLPETIFKVMVRLHFYERYQCFIDSVKIDSFCDRLAKAQEENNGTFDLSELGLTTLDGFVDLLVLSDEQYPVIRLICWEIELNELCESLKLLPHLISLDAMKNKIRKLPDWIGELKALERLNLSGNQLSSIPESIGDLEKLTGLYISFNWITELPESLGRLRNLQGLYMKNSSVNRLPCSFVYLKNLTILVCDPVIKALLPYEIKEQLKRANLALIAHRGEERVLPDERVRIPYVLPPAYQKYM